MKITFDKDNIKEKIGEGLLLEAFEHLSTIMVGHEKENLFRIVQANYLRLIEHEMIGTITREEYNRDINQITHNILRFLDDISTEEANVKFGKQHETGVVKRICMVSSEYPPHFLGGLGMHVYYLTKALSKEIEIDVILPSQTSGYVDICPEISLKPLSKIFPRYEDPISWLTFSKFAADKIERLTPLPEVIHCHDWVTILAGIRARYRLRVPLVYHLHLPNKDVLCASVENLGLICADLITVNSESMLEEVKERNLPIRAEIQIVPNGVDTEVFYSSPQWPEHGGYILFVGRLVEQKGLYYLLHAFKYVLQKYPHVSLIIAGEGPSSREIQDLAKNLEIAEKIQFVGKKEGQELSNLYQNAEVVVVPSIYEPFGMTALEAMACKRSVVASRVGGLMENVKHRETGFLFANKDYLDLAQWIMAILDNRDLQVRFGENAEKYITNNNMTWPRIANYYLKSYSQLRNTNFSTSIPKQFEKFKKQIFNLSKRHPDTGHFNSDLLNQLFKLD